MTYCIIIMALYEVFFMCPKQKFNFYFQKYDMGGQNDTDPTGSGSTSLQYTKNKKN